jgi:hypothetical protein
MLHFTIPSGVLLHVHFRVPNGWVQDVIMTQNRTWEISGAQIDITINYTVFTLSHLTSTILPDNLATPHKAQ